MKSKAHKKNNVSRSKLSFLRKGLGGALVFLFTISLHAQQKDWQWIKQGGAKIEGNEREAVYDIATDSDRNVYVVSPIGVYDLSIDGNPKTFYDSPGSSVGDYALASFACDGTYRWSKIIGGRDRELPPYIETDTNDNLYMAGMFGSCTSKSQGNPPRIENDIVLPGQSPTDCSLLYISKFDKNGNLLWFKRPMPQTADAIGGAFDSYSYNIAIDANANIYWLVAIPPGTYANGAFVNTMQGTNRFIFKYDASGNFINAVYLDIELGSVFAVPSLKMYRNPHNGYFYFTGNKDSNGSATVGGQTVTGSLYLTCFDGQGNFQWMRQNTYNSVAGGSLIYSLDFDNQNNIYMGGKFIGAVGHPSDVFLGQSVPEQNLPHFVMKTNPNATNVFWFSYSNFASAFEKGDFSIVNNKVAYTDWGAGQNFAWGNQTIDINNITGGEVLVAFFDKNTGACTSLDFIQGNDGHSDAGTALAFDANGDVLVGGEFGHILYDANGGQVMNPSPGNPDFFIAKYATEPCPPLGVEEVEETSSIKVFPNPSNGKFYVSTGIWEKLDYHLYTASGKLVKEGTLTKTENWIEVKAMATGVYLLKLKSEFFTRHLRVVLE